MARRISLRNASDRTQYHFYLVVHKLLSGGGGVESSGPSHSNTQPGELPAWVLQRLQEYNQTGFYAKVRDVWESHAARRASVGLIPTYYDGLVLMSRRSRPDCMDTDSPTETPNRSPCRIDARAQLVSLPCRHA